MPDTRSRQIETLTRLLRPLGLALGLMLCAAQSMADSLIVLSRDLDSYRQVAQSITAELDTPSRTITLSEMEQAQFRAGTYQQVIAVGSLAGETLLTQLPDQQDLFISFIPQQTYSNLLQKHENHPRVRAGRVTAVFLDQPYSRQLALARLIKPDATQLATALGPHSSENLKTLQRAADAENFILSYETLQETDNPILKLQPLIRNADLFLALPDKSVFNRTTAKWILYISFRQRIPLIGFSRKYVEAGALASVYSTPAQIGKQTAESILERSRSGDLSPPQYPKHFSVAVNKTAAHSLRVDIASEEELTEKLRERER
ncbi:ABC transporter substrate-binding protein [Neptuniibacter halophilus]|uniref:ABC transporter substrate-binding protein n=1 Tax=Neptuniibacter halophilus TaxID=651666 RepID=UPI002572322E|nr:ABC transporter substrate binding protein [Neptuniibacter halophilus]